MSPLATLCDLPIRTLFDCHAATSCASLDWVTKSGLGALDSQISGPLMLPSDVGVISMRLNNIPVAVSLSSDLLLGLDWFDFVRSRAPHLVIHLDSGSLDFRRPFVMVRTTESGSLTTVTPAVTPVFRGGTGDVEHISSPPSVSLGNSDAVSAPSSVPCTRGIDVVAASHAAQTPINHEIIPINNETLNISSHDDLFVYLTLNEKRSIVRMLVRDQPVPVATLRKMVYRHTQITERQPGERRKKNAETLRAEFLAHRCSEGCWSLVFN
ncbi:hypothetical protein C8R47DRAFT_1234391 [Mycena vitilis]|nr:hypothetical protein C8R47DRAFT_1234391 [Mycena vitilis]